MAQKVKKDEKQRLLILKGEGANSHFLEADVLTHAKENPTLSEITVGEGGVLKHLTPAGEPAEHNAIPLEKGSWLVGRQVEWNAFDQSIGQVFD